MHSKMLSKMLCKATRNHIRPFSQTLPHPRNPCKNHYIIQECQIALATDHHYKKHSLTFRIPPSPNISSVLLIKNIKWKFGNVGSISIKKHQMDILYFWLPWTWIIHALQDAQQGNKQSHSTIFSNFATFTQSMEKTQENHRKIIGTNIEIIMALFGPFMVHMYLNNTFNSFIDFFCFRLVE